MNNEFGMYQGYNVESKSMEMSASSTNMTNANMAEGCCPNNMPGIVCPPVYECPRERCVHRRFVHEVPHVVPINTRVINHHVYKHTYSPCYTCTEEHEVSNENPCCPGMF